MTVLLCVLLVLLCTVSLQSIGAALPIIILCMNKHFFLSECITVLISLYVFYSLCNSVVMYINDIAQLRVARSLETVVDVVETETGEEKESASTSPQR